jgi:RNA polymerase sigma-70 factor, ECF subfamily
LLVAEVFCGGVTIPLFDELGGMDHSDAQIIRRVIAGDAEAFGLLVDRYHGRCLRAACNLLNDSDEAEDAVQEAFVRAYRHLASYQERDRFAAWLLRIVVNQCRTRAVSARRWTRLDEDFDAGHDDAMLADNASLQRERRAELAYALGQLGHEHREAIVLRFGEELSFDEMSAVTGVGISALKMRVQRACARLRALLSESINA